MRMDTTTRVNFFESPYPPRVGDFDLDPGTVPEPESFRLFFPEPEVPGRGDLAGLGMEVPKS